MKNSSSIPLTASNAARRQSIAVALTQSKTTVPDPTRCAGPDRLTILTSFRARSEASVGNSPPVGCGVAVEETSSGETTPASARVAMNALRRKSAPESRRASGLRNRRNSANARRAPALTPAAKPRFASRNTQSMPGNCSRQCPRASRDPLSTTMTWLGASGRDAKSSRQSRRRSGVP